MTDRSYQRDCWACEASISMAATYCPHCGEVQPNAGDDAEIVTDGGEAIETETKWYCTRCGKVTSSEPFGECYDCGGEFTLVLDESEIACAGCGSHEASRVSGPTALRFCKDCLAVEDPWYVQAYGNVEEWGLQDVETLLLAMQEEQGELAQAFLEASYEDGDWDRIVAELADLGALVIQLRWRLRNNWGELA